MSRSPAGLSISPRVHAGPSTIKPSVFSVSLSLQNPSLSNLILNACVSL
jgi:hypothetical protein